MTHVWCSQMLFGPFPHFLYHSTSPRLVDWSVADYQLSFSFLVQVTSHNSHNVYKSCHIREGENSIHQCRRGWTSLFVFTSPPPGWRSERGECEELGQGGQSCHASQISFEKILISILHTLECPAVIEMRIIKSKEWTHRMYSCSFYPTLEVFVVAILAVST